MADEPEVDETEAQPDAPAPEPAPVAPPAKTDNAVEAWIDKHIRGTSLAQHTPSWNVLVGAIPHLKAMLKEV